MQGTAGHSLIATPSNEVYLIRSSTYIKPAELPQFYKDLSPITPALCRRDFFVTSGEVLIPLVSIEGSGGKRKVVVEVNFVYGSQFIYDFRAAFIHGNRRPRVA